MVPLSQLLTFAAAAALLIALPGPSVLFVIGRTLALGRRAGLLSVVGNASGMLVQTAAVALGVGAIIAESIAVLTVVKLAGAAYLIFLGIQAIRHRHEVQAPVERAVPRSAWRLLAQGFVVGVTNPKSIVFFVAILPQFVDPAAGPIPPQLAELGLVFVVLALGMDSIWALTAGAARHWFARSPRRLSRLGVVGGVMMIGLGGTLAVTGAKS
ncbi:LysE family translocator [Lysinimonas soli]|uniref:LysE family translocator n=1 Tax=Lysinimonas soli TaxID=1074233 RepID=A0ABW0NP02_9MICO